MKKKLVVLALGVLGFFVSEVASAAQWNLPCGVIIYAPGYYDYIGAGYSKEAAKSMVEKDAVYYLEKYCKYENPTVEFID